MQYFRSEPKNQKTPGKTTANQTGVLSRAVGGRRFSQIQSTIHSADVHLGEGEEAWIIMLHRTAQRPSIHIMCTQYMHGCGRAGV